MFLAPAYRSAIDFYKINDGSLWLIILFQKCFIEIFNQAYIRLQILTHIFTCISASLLHAVLHRGIYASQKYELKESDICI